MENKKFKVGSVYKDNDGDLVRFLGNDNWEWIIFRGKSAQDVLDSCTTRFNVDDTKRLGIKELTPLEKAML